MICRFGDFDAASICPITTPPSLLSRLLSILGIQTAFHAHSFLKWSALLLALLAALTTVANRFSTLIVKFHLQTHNNNDDDDKLASSSQSHLIDGEDDFSDDDEDTIPSTSDDEAEPEPSFHRRQRSFGYDDDFRVAGYSGDRFSWSDFAADEKSVVSLWGGDVNTRLVVSAGDLRSPTSAVVKLWDRRMGRGFPAICGEWSTGSAELVKRASPETWWDADAVVVSGDWFGKSAANGCCESVVTRCREMVWHCLF